MNIYVSTSTNTLNCLSKTYFDFFRKNNDYDVNFPNNDYCFEQVFINESFEYCFTNDESFGIIIISINSLDDEVVIKHNGTSQFDFQQYKDKNSVFHIIFPFLWEYTFYIKNASVFVSKLYPSMKTNKFSLPFCPVRQQNCNLHYIEENNLNDLEINFLLEYFHFRRKVQGITGTGLDKNIKDTTEVLFDMNMFEHVWLKNKLHSSLSKYIDHIGFPLKNIFENSMYTYITRIQIQKYTQNSGHYVKHIDSYRGNRILVFIWYLNDVQEGGETILYNDTVKEKKIKPKKGSLLIFPTNFTQIHSGNIPISNDKFIMTGWVHL